MDVKETDIIEAIQLNFKLSTVSSTDVEQNQLKRKVFDYLNTLNSNVSCWKAYLSILTTDSNTLTDEVKFYTLQRLRDAMVSNGLSRNYILNIKAQFIPWLFRITNLLEEKPFIRNFLAVIYTLLIKYLFPDDWLAAFDQLIEFGTKIHVLGGVSFVLKVLLYVDQEIVSFKANRSKEEMAHNTVIKDKMRDMILNQLVEFWYYVIVSCQESNPLLVLKTLKVMQEYIGWIDLNLTVNDSMLPLLYSLLKSPLFRNDTVDCLYEIFAKGMPGLKKYQLIQSTNIVKVLVASSKTSEVVNYTPNITSSTVFSAQALQELKSVKQNCYSAAQVESEVKQEYFAVVCDLCELLLAELDKAYSELSQQNIGESPVDSNFFQLIDAIVSFSLSTFLPSSKIEVRRSGIKVADALVTKIRSELKAMSISYSQYVTSTQNVTIGKIYSKYLVDLVKYLLTSMSFPSQEIFELDEDDEDKLLFYELRKDFRNLFINISRFSIDEITLPFLTSLVNDLPPKLLSFANNPKFETMCEVEALLIVIQAIPESVSNIFNFLPDKDARKEQSMQSIGSSLYQIVLLLLQKKDKILSFNNSIILITYFEILTRYLPLIFRFPLAATQTKINPLQAVLGSFLGNHGINNENQKIRSVAIYLLLRNIKNIYNYQASFLFQQNQAKLILNFIKAKLEFDVNVVKESLQDNIENASNNLSLDDVLNLYEIASYLINVEDRNTSMVNKVAETQACLESVVTNLKEILNVLRTSGSNLSKEDLFICDQWSGTCFQVIIAFSKAFTSSTNVDECKMFISFIDIGFDILVSLKSNRNFAFIKKEYSFYQKLVTYLHRVYTIYKPSPTDGAEAIILNALDLSNLSSKILQYCRENKSCKELQAFIQLLNQIMREFKRYQTIQKLVDNLLQPVIQDTYSFTSKLSNFSHLSDTTTLTEEEREIIDLDKTLLLFFNEIICNNFYSVLISETNLACFQDVMLYITNKFNVESGSDIQTLKLCLNILISFLRKWLLVPSDQQSQVSLNKALLNLLTEQQVVQFSQTSPKIDEQSLTVIQQITKLKHSIPGGVESATSTAALENVFVVLLKFVFTQSVHITLKCIRSKEFNHNEGQTLQFISLLNVYHLNLVLILREVWLGYFIQTLLNNPDMPSASTSQGQQALKEYVHAILLNSKDQKQLRISFIKLFIQH